MQATLQTTPAPPSEDKRWRIVQTTMRRYGFASDALIESLSDDPEITTALMEVVLATFGR